MTESIDIVNCKENKESQQKLFQLLEDGAAVLFVGSGSSRRLGYPSWEGILNDLSDLLPNDSSKALVQQKIKDEELLLAAEIIKNKINTDDYNSRFEEYFKHKHPSSDDLHKLLVKLKFKGFVTTNYDPVIESALRAFQGRHVCDVVISATTKRDVHQFLKSLNSNNWKERYHLYLHGKFHHPSTTIFSYGDYVKKYNGIDITLNSFYPELIKGNLTIEEFESKIELKKIASRNALHYNIIYVIMATQRIVYLGYGLRDPYLNKIVNDIQSDFRTEYDDFHFALVSSNSAKNWTEKEYLIKKEEWSLKGIELIFYQDNESYTGIEDFVSGLSPESFITSSIEPRQVDRKVKKETEEPITEEKEDDETVNEKLKSKMLKTIEELKRK